MTLKVVDRFTTRDGLWEVDPRPYGITKEMLDKYGSQRNELGGASHIYVKVKPGDRVRFFTRDATTPQMNLVIAETEWANFGMWKSSAFWAPNVGPWYVSVNGVEVAKGLGLPDGLHVSTFLIVEDVDEGSQPDTPDTPPVGVSHIQVLVNGVVKSEFWI